MYLVFLESCNNLVREGGHFAEKVGGTRVKTQGTNNNCLIKQISSWDRSHLVGKDHLSLVSSGSWPWAKDLIVSDLIGRGAQETSGREWERKGRQPIKNAFSSSLVLGVTRMQSYCRKCLSELSHLRSKRTAVIFTPWPSVLGGGCSWGRSFPDICSSLLAGPPLPIHQAWMVGRQASTRNNVEWKGHV